MGTLKEPSQRDGSFENPKYMIRNNKNIKLKFSLSGHMLILGGSFLDLKEIRLSFNF